jgi:hypothetical protein
MADVGQGGGRVAHAGWSTHHGISFFVSPAESLGGGLHATEATLVPSSWPAPVADAAVPGRRGEPGEYAVDIGRGHGPDQPAPSITSARRVGEDSSFSSRPPKGSSGPVMTTSSKGNMASATRTSRPAHAVSVRPRPARRRHEAPRLSNGPGDAPRAGRHHPWSSPANLTRKDGVAHASPRTFSTILLSAHSPIPMASSTPARM